MKKKYLVIFLLIFTFCIVRFIDVKSILTDSGFDYGYDSGSSSSSPSRSSRNSSGNNSRRNSSHNTSNNEYHSEPRNLSNTEKIISKIFLILFGLIIVVIGVYFFYVFNKAIFEVFKDTFKHDRAFLNDFKNIKYKQMEENKIKELIPNFNSEIFIKNCIDIFISVQKNWSDFNYDGLRSDLSDELYNQYVMQLKTLAVKNQTNIMRDFKPRKCVIEDVFFDNGLYYAKVKLLIDFKDYIVQGKKVVRGSSRKKCRALYSLTFVSSDNFIETCPHCGASINNDSSQVCEYCKSTIVRISDKWVLNNKKIDKQFQIDNTILLINKNIFKVFKFIIQFVMAEGLAIGILSAAIYLFIFLIKAKL